MSRVVLDASAVVAVLRGEPGSADALPVVQGAAISAANLSEVVALLVRGGAAERAEVDAIIDALSLDIIPVDRDLAVEAGLMATATRSAGLSLGDRFCLALARRLRLPALTTDRAWASVAPSLGVEVRLLR